MSWDKVRLGEVADKIGSGSTPKGGALIYQDEGTALIRSQNVYNMSFTTDGLVYINDVEAAKLKGVTIFENDVLINITGDSVARTCVVPNEILPARVNQHVCIVRAKPELLNARFLNYYLASPYMQSYMLGLAVGKGTSRNALTKEMIANFPIPFPPLAVQQKIARILSRYDALVANCRKQIKLLEEAAERLYKEWFVDLRFPGSETSTLNEQGLPDGWEVRPLNEVAPIVTGKKDANYGCDKGKYPFFTCAKEAIKAPGYSFDGDAVILAGNGDFSVKMFRGKFEAYQRTYVLMPSNPKMLYLLYFSVLSKLQSLVSGASGSTIKFLTKGMIESLQVIVPEQSIFEQFYEAQQSFLRGIEIAKSTLSLLTEARDRLLPKLMSGEIEV